MRKRNLYKLNFYLPRDCSNTASGFLFTPKLKSAYADLFEMAGAYGAKVEPVIGENDQAVITMFSLEKNRLVGGKTYSESQCYLEPDAAYFPVYQLAKDLDCESKIHKKIFSGGSAVTYIAEYGFNADQLSYFMAGVAEGCISDIEANWDLITNPEQLMNIVSQIYILAHPYLYPEETRLICEQIYTAAMSAKDYWTNADEDTKARLIGKAVGAIFTEAILFKGIGTASIALKASAESGLLATWIGKIGRGEETAAGTATKFKTVAETIAKYGDDAARAIERGIEPSIINRLADVEVTPSLYDTFRITSRESAESLLNAIARRLSRTATQADIDLISSLRIKYNAGATRNIAFAKGNIGGDVIDLETVSGEAMKGNFTPPSTNYYHGRLGYQYHTEQNIIEYLRETYKNNPNISGRIEIVSERAYCDNCVDIVDQFQAEFKNIEVVRVETQ